MLLKNISDKVRDDIARTNRGEKPEPRRKPERQSRERNLVRQEAFNPEDMENLPDGFVSRILHTQDSLPEPQRHNVGYTHLSALLKNPCVRQLRFMDENQDKQVFQSVTGAHRLMWKLGRAIETHIRETYIKGVKGKGVFGNWECACGAVKHAGKRFSETWLSCQRCRTKPDNYKEYTVFDHDAGIAGNPDFLVYGGDILTVVEIKSMNGEDFELLRAPMPDHVYQAAGYRRLLKQNGFNVSKNVVIVYATKKFKYGSPYKEFSVDVTVPQYENVLNGMWGVAQEIKQSRLAKTIPPRKVCSSVNAKEAKKCSFCTDCFMRG